MANQAPATATLFIGALEFSSFLCTCPETPYPLFATLAFFGHDLLLSRLLRGCDSGLLVPKDDAAISVLSALVDLARPDESARLPWTPQPLLRAVCPKAAAKQVGKVLKVRIWIYFRRLLFEMIAYPPLMTIMRAIDPVGEVRRTVALPPLESPTFVSHAPADMSSGPDYSFSLAGLMKAQVMSTCIRALACSCVHVLGGIRVTLIQSP